MGCPSFILMSAKRRLNRHDAKTPRKDEADFLGVLASWRLNFLSKR
jgi:hypothetical protein